MRVKLLFLHKINSNTKLKNFPQEKKNIFAKTFPSLHAASLFPAISSNFLSTAFPSVGNLNKYLYNLLSNFPRPSDEAALTTWLSKIRKTIQDFKTHYISEKEMFAQRLGQCLCGSNSLKVHSLVVEVYELVF